MKTIKFVFGFIVLTIPSQAIYSQESQMEYFPIGTIWEEVFTKKGISSNFTADYNSRTRYEVSRDTIIDNRTYKIVTVEIVENSNPNGQTGPQKPKFIREQNDSVFCWDKLSYQDERLIYNFNWQDTGNIKWVSSERNRKELVSSQVVLEDGKIYNCYSDGKYPSINQLIWSIGETVGGILSQSVNRSFTVYLTKFSRSGVLLYENEVFSFNPVDNQRHTIVMRGSGQLAPILDQYPLTETDSITIFGYLNGSDIYKLRRMLNAQDVPFSDSSEYDLRYLDLTAAHIHDGGGSYVTLEGGNLYTSNDIIGDLMFSLCPAIEEVKLPYGVNSIGNGVFMGSSSLKRVTIPEKVRTIGSYVFQDCASLESVSFPYTITSLGDGLVEGCTSLRSVACAATEPPTCTENTFGDMAGVTLYVPMGCADKYRESTGWNRFVDIVEPDPMAINVNEAGTLDSIINVLGLDNTGRMKVSGELDGTDIRVLRRMLGGLYNIALEDDRGRGKLYHLDLSDAVIVSGGQEYFFIDVLRNSYLAQARTANDVVGQYMFVQCLNLEQVILPTGIKTIDENAFIGCTRLKELTVPEGVETIGSQAFDYCYAMRKLSLPSTLTSLGDLVGAGKVESLTCLATEPPTCTEATFTKTNTDAVLYVPAGCVEKYSNSVGWREFFDVREYDPLGISELVEPLQEKREGIYDLQGRKLSSIPAKGIYIQNGKKYVR